MSDTETQVVQPVSANHVVYAVMRFVRIVQRRRMIVFAALTGTLLIGALYYATAERIYQGTAQLLVLNNQVDVWNESNTQDSHRQGMLPTYERLFYSSRVLNGAIDNLKELALESALDRLVGEGWISFPQKQEVVVALAPFFGHGNVGNLESLPLNETLAEFVDPDTIAHLQKLASAAEREALIDLQEYPRDKWIDEIRDRLGATAVRSTNIIEISYRSKKPRTAELMVNAIVKSYTDYVDESHRDVAVDIGELLEVHASENQRKLEENNKALRDAKLKVKDLGITKEDVVHPAVHRVNKLHAELVEIQQQRIRLQSSRVALGNALASGGNLQQHLLALEPTVGKEVVLAALGLSTKDGEVLTHLERMLFEEQATLDRLSNFYLENHPEMVRLSNRVMQIRQRVANYASQQAEIASEAYNQNLGQMLLSLVDEDLRQTMLHEQALLQEYQFAESEAMEIADGRETVRFLEKEEQRLHDAHTRLLDRLDDIALKTNQSDVLVSVPSEAKAENKPVSPRLLWILFMSVASGLLGGSGIIYVMDVMDDRFRAPEELREQLGVPVLAIIRSLTELPGKRADSLHVHAAADSVESEAFRTLRTTLAFSGQELDCLAISSSEPSDGKTTVLANLAVSAAQTGTRTLIIDADMRRPGMSKLFEVRSKKGLGNILRSSHEVAELAAEFVLPTGVPNLTMLPAGIRPLDPTGSLSGTRFGELLVWAQEEFDHVLIDTPPILAASDASIIGRLVDGLILVVQPEKNNRRVVHRAAEEIQAARLNFLGVVANNVSQEADGYGYGYGYGYGHGYGHDELDEFVEVTDQAAAVKTTEDAIVMSRPEQPPRLRPNQTGRTGIQPRRKTDPKADAVSGSTPGPAKVQPRRAA